MRHTLKKGNFYLENVNTILTFLNSSLESLNYKNVCQLITSDLNDANMGIGKYKS